MPFPSGRCQTCRARHLKCDEVRPVCSRCQKSNRECIWDDRDGNDLLFRDENPFASSSARRERGGARRKAKPSQTALSSKTNDLRSGELILHNLSLDLRKRSPTSEPTSRESSHHSPLVYQISESLLERARVTTHAAYVVWDGTLSSDVWGYLYRQKSKLFPSGKYTLFDTAFDAFALRHYGSRTGSKEAEVAGARKYAETLIRLRQVLRGSNDAHQDDVVLAILLLASCEDNMSVASTKNLLLQGYTHMKGATALFEVRRSNPAQAGQDVELDNIVRRRVVRQAIYMGEAIPLSMCEELTETVDFDVMLDILIGKIANLRNEMIRIFTCFEDYTSSERQAHAHELLYLLDETSILDAKLSAWHSRLPPEWAYEQCCLSDENYAALSTNSVFHTKRYDDYSRSGLDVVISLNRYRAARLLCLGYVSRILTEPELFESLEFSQAQLRNVAKRLSLQLSEEAVLGYTIGTIRLFTEEIIRSIPTFFSHPHPPISLTSTTVVENASPAKLMQLVWPVVIASSITICPEAERQFLKKITKFIGELSGNRSLTKVAGLHLHGSFMQRVVDGKLFYSSE